MAGDSYFETEQENKLLKKVKENPFFPVAITVFTGIVGYGLWGLKNRRVSMSMYLMQLRVASQGSAVAILGLGMMYMMGKRIYVKLNPESKEDPSSSSSSLNPSRF